MKNIIMYVYVIARAFIIWVIFGFIPMMVLFLPILPIMLLGFPMMFLDDTHWSCKPYLWYFKNVWMRYFKLVENIG